MPGPFAISNRLSLRFKPEAAGAAGFGVVPVTGTPYSLRVMSESLKYNLQTAVSNELRADRMTSDVIPVDGDTAGQTPFEWSYGEFDAILAALFCGAWNYAGTVNGESAALTLTIATQNTVTASAGTPFATVVVGQYISFTGFATPANNNKPLKVATVTGGGAGVTFAGTPLTNEAAVANCKFRGARLTNGSTVQTFDIERVNNDLTLFECFRGQFPNKLSVDFKTGSVVTVTPDWLGKDALPMAAVTAFVGALQASLANTIMNSVNNLSGFMEGGAALTSTYVKSFKLNVNNNARVLKALGVLGAVGLQLGECDVDGDLEVYLADASIYNKYLNNTLTSLQFQLQDGAGNAYIIQIPAVKYQTAERPSGGKNSDIMVKLGWQALRDPTTNAQIIIDRCGAAVTPWA